MTTTTDRGLQELEQHIRQSLPMAKTITQFEFQDDIQAVTFHWQGRSFLVRRSFETLETRGRQLVVSGASMLIQSALMKKNKNEKVLTAVIEIVRQAEEMLTSNHRMEAGLKMLATAKSSLSKLSGGKPTNTATSNSVVFGR